MSEQLLRQDSTEHRRSQRRTTLKSGHIMFNDARSSIDCTVRNLSRHGAKLRVASVLGVPETFELVLGDQRRQPCKVVWRKVDEVGVAFV